jgi:hypothetical protein
MEGKTMSFNEYLIRYWHMTEKEFTTFSAETKKRIRKEYERFSMK